MGIGSDLGYLRRQQGISQITISHKTGLSQQYIGRIKQDKPTTVETNKENCVCLQKITKLYNVALVVLIW